jgi:branched-subunit amino acid aminotransferase/4-amino-4-deoxychorismate lyase
LDIDPRHFSRIKQSAKKRNLEFNITPEFLHELFYKQDQKSAITGVLLVLPKYEGGGTGLSNNPSENDDYIASLDRIDSSKGYTEDNVWWIGRRENICKSNLTIQDLYNFLRNGYEYLEISRTLMKEIQTGSKNET